MIWFLKKYGRILMIISRLIKMMISTLKNFQIRLGFFFMMLDFAG